MTREHDASAAPPAHAPLLVEEEPPLTWVTVNRPEARNALNAAVWRGLAETVRALSVRSDVRVIILRGAGEQAFIAGADIAEFRTLRGDATAAAEYDRLSADTWTALGAAPQPVIAMINGLCFGGGVSIALACDLRLAAAHAQFAIPAVRLGLAYPAVAVERLVWTVGPTAAADMLFSGRVLDAEEAARVGLIGQIVPAAELEAVTRRDAQEIAKGAPLTIAAHKRTIQELLRSPHARDPAAVAEAIRRCFDSADYQEGIAAFLEKRAPRFAGR
jgi:enoyl-CoA hydratase/carnithine racemase